MVSRNLKTASALIAVAALVLTVLCSTSGGAQTKKQRPRSAAKPGGNTTAKYKGIFEPIPYPEDVELLDVDFANEKVGWAAGGTSTMKGGFILATKDEGATWKVQAGDPQSEDRAMRELRFSDEKNGWAVQPTGQAAKLLHTSDGENWTEVGSIPEHYTDYQFVSPTAGFVAEGSKIFGTSDAGHTWTPGYQCATKLEVKGLAREVECDIAAFSFLSPQLGYAIGNSSQAPGVFMLKTQDGGANWNVWLVLPDENGRESAIHFSDENNGALRTGGKFFATSDGGKTWNGVVGATVRGKPPMRFAGSVGWSIGYNTLAFTTNKGKRWTTRSIPFPAQAQGWTLPKPDRAYVVGEHGMAYRYRVVPSSFTAPKAIEGPAMPSSTGEASPQ